MRYLGAQGLRPRLAPNYVVGRWHDQRTNSGPTGTNTMGANFVYFSPNYLHKTVGIDRVAVQVQTAGSAGASSRLGLYSMDPATGAPLALLETYGDVTTTTTGVKEIVLSGSVVPVGWSFFAIATNSIAPGAFIGVSPGGVDLYLGGSTAMTITNGLRATTTNSALPSPPDSVLSNYTHFTHNNSVPLVSYRISSA